jgi:hypothetical protein
VRFITVITQFQVARATNCGALIQFINASYVVGHKSMSDIHFGVSCLSGEYRYYSDTDTQSVVYYTTKDTVYDSLFCVIHGIKRGP